MDDDRRPNDGLDRDDQARPILELTAELPEVALDAGDVLIAEGAAGGGVWILVSGSLRVVKTGIAITTINHPGAIIGEMSLLLGRPYSATVEATEPTRLRYAEDGDALLASDPSVTRTVAAGLAERLAFVTTYLADLTQQYGDAPGLSMVSTVLNQLEQRKVPRAMPGSLREPNPEY
jgi:CRP-like cAMP-binding protein